MKAIIPFVLLAANVVAAEDLVVSKYPPLVTPEIDKQIEDTLAYLAKQQDMDGKWDIAFSTTKSPYPNLKWTTVSTSAIALAFLAHGDLPDRGTYSRNVNAALHWMINTADPKTGQITTREDSERPMYGHCHAILFLSELYGMEGDAFIAEKIKPIIEKGVSVIEKAQAGNGGWCYTFIPTKTSAPNDSPSENWDGLPNPPGELVDDDEGSVTIHAIQALRAAKNAGFSVDKNVIEKGLKYLINCQNKDGGIKYWSTGEQPSKPAVSAAAVATFYMAGVYQLSDKEYEKSNDVRARAVKRCWEYTKRTFGNQIELGAIQDYPLYAHLYLAEASWISKDNHWNEYYPRISKWLLKDSSLRHPSLPIWRSVDADNYYYNTAAALLILQIPYQKLPILQR